VPARLRPTAPIAPDAIVVGDPGRALLLAQELLVEPRMSNHARGLWGYHGRAATGGELTIQATGMGGPSAVLVLEDLAELGVRRAIRVGTCVALGEDFELGELLAVRAAIAGDGSSGALGIGPGHRVPPDEALDALLRRGLGEGAEEAVVLSVDVHPSRAAPENAKVADMQTAPFFAAARALGVGAAAVLIVVERSSGGVHLDVEALADAERRAGKAALAALLP
jgi:purine-nucleoside phosphorylase